MQEKDMVLDILSGAKASLGNYAKCIIECNDQGLRQTFQQMRNSDEKFQYDLYKTAEQKGWYIPPPNATPQDMSGLRTQLSKGMGPGM